MSRLHALASERNYISKEPIATCIPIEDAQTLNGTLSEGRWPTGLSAYNCACECQTPQCNDDIELALHGSGRPRATSNL